jgi:hypothetical protein
MTRSSANFRKGDVRRAVEAIRSSGEVVLRVEIDPRTGKIVVVTAGKAGDTNNSTVNEWDCVLRDKH